jgi:hypothetical protein
MSYMGPSLINLAIPTTFRNPFSLLVGTGSGRSLRGVYALPAVTALALADAIYLLTLPVASRLHHPGSSAAFRTGNVPVAGSV